MDVGDVVSQRRLETGEISACVHRNRRLYLARHRPFLRIHASSERQREELIVGREVLLPKAMNVLRILIRRAGCSATERIDAAYA